MRFIDKFKSWKGKKVIIRVDFNVPIEKGDILGEMWRVESSIPTIKFLLDQEVSRIVFLTHIGRPKGKVVDALSTKHLIYTLNKLLGEKVAFVNGFNIKNLRNRIILLENLRFHIEEKENNENFAKKLAKLGDIYVNDAFSVSHRAHASIDAITKFLPCFGGFEMKREIQVLTGAYNNLISPLSVIIGGIKVGTKLKIIEHFLKKGASVIVGGALANTLLHIKGIAIGSSVIDKKVIDQLIFKLLPVFCDLILKQKILENSFILFVDYGSQDNTWSIIKNLCEQKNYFKAIKLSRNYGHQQALLSGLLAAKENADFPYRSIAKADNKMRHLY